MCGDNSTWHKFKEANKTPFFFVEYNYVDIYIQGIHLGGNAKLGRCLLQNLDKCGTT